jgi:hypothetical protein
MMPRRHPQPVAFEQGSIPFQLLFDDPRRKDIANVQKPRDQCVFRMLHKIHWSTAMQGFTGMNHTHGVSEHERLL